MLDNPIIVREPCKELDKPQTRLIQKVILSNRQIFYIDKD